MKTLKFHNNLFLIVNPIIIIAGLIIYWKAYQYIPAAFYIFWIPALIGIAIVLSPLGKKTLCQNHDEVAKRIPLSGWLGRIFLLEGTMIGSYAGISYVCGSYFPIMTTPHNNLFSEGLKNILSVGVFPWLTYAVIAAGMSSLAYRHFKNAYFSTLLNPFKEHDPHDQVAIITNVGVRRCSILAVSLSLMLMAMVLLSFLKSFDIDIIYGFKTTTLMTTLFLLGLSYTNTAKTYLDRVFARKTPIAFSLLSFILIFSFSVFLLNLLTHTMVVNAGTKNQAIPKIIQLITQKDWHTAWSITSGLWVLLLIPAVSGYLANISKGYQARELILATALPPLLISIAAHFLEPSLSHKALLPPLTIKVITLLCFWVFLSLILNKKTLPNVIVSYFPKDGLVKQRDILPFFRKVVMFTVIIFYIFFVLGITGVSMFLFVLTYLFIISFIFAAISTIKYLAKDNLDKNQ